MGGYYHTSMIGHVISKGSVAETFRHKTEEILLDKTTPSSPEIPFLVRCNITRAFPPPSIFLFIHTSSHMYTNECCLNSFSGRILFFWGGVKYNLGHCNLISPQRSKFSSYHLFRTLSIFFFFCSETNKTLQKAGTMCKLVYCEPYFSSANVKCQLGERSDNTNV